MADATYADLDPQDTDSELDLRLKRMLVMQACVTAAGGTPDAAHTPQVADGSGNGGDAPVVLARKELQIARELQAALGG